MSIFESNSIKPSKPIVPTVKPTGSTKPVVIPTIKPIKPVAPTKSTR